MTRSTTTTLAVLILALLARPLTADDAAKLAPADSGVFIQIDELAQLRAVFQDDPLFTWLQRQIPGRPGAEMWSYLEDLLGMNTTQIVDTYFGRQLLVIAAEPGDGKPGAVLSRVAAQDAQLGIQRLDLLPLGAAGPFKLYSTADGNGRFAFSDEWMGISDVRHADYFSTVLTGPAPGQSLAEDATFKALVGRLPGQRSALVYSRQREPQEIHAIGVRLQDRDLLLDYAGRNPQAAARLAVPARPLSADFGPLPRTTLAAGVLCIAPPPIDNPRLLDRLLGPKRSFVNEVLPKLDLTVLAFLGEVPAKAITPEIDRPYPVLGLALRLKDPAAAADLDKIMQGLVFLANLQTAQWEGVDPAAQEQAVHQGHEYHVVDLGVPLAQRAGRAELGGIRLAYGRIGDWYVLCTQDQFYRACLDAAADKTKGLAAADLAKALPAGDPRDVGRAVVNAQALARHLQAWLDFWKTSRPELLEAGGAGASPEARLARGVSIAAEALQHFHVLEARLALDADQVLTGHIALRRVKP